VISVYSQQRRGNNCGVSGPVTVKGNNLIFTQHDPLDVISFGQGFAINFSHGLVTFKYRPTPQAGLPPFCGSEGNLEFVKFRLTDRVPAGSHKCDG
jgi:hypothetical protein